MLPLADVWRSVKPHRCGIADVTARSERATGVRIESASRRRSPPRILKYAPSCSPWRYRRVKITTRERRRSRAFHFTNSSFFNPHVPSIGVMESWSPACPQWNAVLHTCCVPTDAARCRVLVQRTHWTPHTGLALSKRTSPSATTRI